MAHLSRPTIALVPVTATDSGRASMLDARTLAGCQRMGSTGLRVAARLAAIDAATELLGHATPTGPWRVTQEPGGAPALLTADGSEPVRVSLSHCAGWGVALAWLA